MGWQDAIGKAKRELRKEAAGLQKKLSEVQRRIRELDSLQRPLKASAPTRPVRELSPQGRAAISKAAKKRWAAYRREHAPSA